MISSIIFLRFVCYKLSYFWTIQALHWSYKEKMFVGMSYTSDMRTDMASPHLGSVVLNVRVWDFDYGGERDKTAWIEGSF